MFHASEHEEQYFAQGPRPAQYRPQFAICYLPRPGTPLATFGRSWFGRANDGTTRRAFSSNSLSGGTMSGTAHTPDRYLGLHAPFFSPLRLHGDAHMEDIKTRLHNFAGRRKPIETGPLVLAVERRALVLKPAEPRPELNWLALQCFNAFEAFASDDAVADNDYPHLSAHQRLLLKSFGQANIMSEYRFAFALTGPLPADRLGRIARALEPLIAGICASGISVDGLSLVLSGDDGRHHQDTAATRLMGRYALAA
ncbi:MAG: DUF1045 domain-containing protein [Pseudomonadota bacterium]